jgi:hypothetical protein
VVWEPAADDTTSTEKAFRPEDNFTIAPIHPRALAPADDDVDHRRQRDACHRGRRSLYCHRGLVGPVIRRRSGRHGWFWCGFLAARVHQW